MMVLFWQFTCYLLDLLRGIDFPFEFDSSAEQDLKCQPVDDVFQLVSEELGASSCKRCAFGQYENATGQSQCRKCPAERTTLGLGSESLAECVCKAGSIESWPC